MDRSISEDTEPAFIDRNVFILERFFSNFSEKKLDLIDKQENVSSSQIWKFFFENRFPFLIIMKGY